TADAHVVVGMEAMTAGDPPGLLRKDLAVDHGVTEQHHQPLGRTDEFILARRPAHALGNRQLVQRALHDGWQQADGRLPGDALAVLELGAALIDLRPFHAALAGEAQRSLGRLAILVEGGLHRWTVQIDGAIRLLAVELADKYGQAARRGIVAGVAVIQSGSLEAFFNT